MRRDDARQDQAGPHEVVQAGHGTARLCETRLVLVIQLRFGEARLVWRGNAGRGVARRGMVIQTGHGEVRHGWDWSGWA